MSQQEDSQFTITVLGSIKTLLFLTYHAYISLATLVTPRDESRVARVGPERAQDNIVPRIGGVGVRSSLQP